MTLSELAISSIGVALLSSSPADAAASRMDVIHVPGDHPTIQEGIDAATDDDVVLVADGTYTGDGNRDIDFQGKKIRLESENGAALTILDVQADSSDMHRGFSFVSMEGLDSVVSGFTIRNGYSDSNGGGAILCMSSSPTIEHCVFEGNQADFDADNGGGAVACYDSNPLLTDCMFDGNRQSSNGGGLFCESSSPDLVGCVFLHNDSARGAGMFCGDESHPTLTDCSFIQNEFDGFSTEQGGGVHCDDSSPSFLRCTFTENVSASGGALYCFRSDPHFEECTFDGNRASRGGAVFGWICDATFLRCTLDGNEASQAGGAFYLESGSDAEIRRNQILNNTAGPRGGGEGNGGALFCDDSAPTILENVFDGNHAFSFHPRGGAIYCVDSSPVVRRNTFTGNVATGDHTHPDGDSRGGAIYLEDSTAIIGGMKGHGNTFRGNDALIGADIFETGAPATIDARHNTFSIFPVSGYYVEPLASFDVSEGKGIYPAIQHDVVVSTTGVDEDQMSGPLLTVRFALSRVSPAPGHTLKIRMEPGVYSPSTTGEVFPLSLMTGVALVGDPCAPVVLDAEQTNQVVYCYGVEYGRVSGLQIQGGVGGSGGGIFCHSSSLEISGNFITGNEGTWGGGIGCTEGSHPTISDNLIANNVPFETIFFAHLGGGIYCGFGSSPLIERNVIVHNSSEWGGALACNQESHPALSANTITENTAETGGGVLAWNDSNPTVVSGILWGNSANSEPEISACCGSSFTVSYTDVAGGWAGTGNIDADPLFVNAAGGDYALQAGSPCIDTGDPLANPDCDGSVVDMGALTTAPCDQPIGVAYCVATANSTGSPASIAAYGSDVVANNAMTLITTDVAPSRYGYYLMSDEQDFVPLFNGSSGNLCLGGQIHRMIVGNEILFSSTCGVMEFTPDLTNLPNGTVFLSGETWNFQLWFRDIVGPDTTSNTSDGVAITWQ